ncbi:hypothetical protein CAPTEDRAFT_101619, partial [Capitella teleta]
VPATERGVRDVLRQVSAPNHVDRRQSMRNRNSIPYSASYPGHKLHMDQNEKLAMFGATHVIAVDGFSSCVTSHTTMPIKNNCLIYEEVYRPTIQTHGMWDTVRVDHGREFYLTLFMQGKNEHLRLNRQRSAYIQTPSRSNLRVERLWPEVNNRVNYPIKAALVSMVDNEALDMQDDLHRFCCSDLTVQTCRVGMQRCIPAWNEHHITGELQISHTFHVRARIT